MPAAYEDVINNASGTGFTAEDGVLYWDNAQVGNLMQGMFLGNSSAEDVPVSYTHLDVYKRQALWRCRNY